MEEPKNCIQALPIADILKISLSLSLALALSLSLSLSLSLAAPVNHEKRQGKCSFTLLVWLGFL